MLVAGGDAVRREVGHKTVGEFVARLVLVRDLDDERFAVLGDERQGVEAARAAPRELRQANKGRAPTSA